MIFVCVGSRNHQFDRLIRKIDELAGAGEIQEDVFAQIGAGGYLPKHIKYERFLESSQYKEMQDKARLIITHGGTASVIGALRKGKQVIAIPRLAKYHEHVDDHQTQIVGTLAREEYIVQVMEIDELLGAIRRFDADSMWEPKRYEVESNVVEIIIQYIG